MEIISAILGAAFVTAGSYSTLCLYDKRNSLEVKRKGSFIYSTYIVLVICLAFITVFALGIIKYGVWDSFDMLLSYLLIWGMSVLAVTDYRQRRIPNRFLMVMLMMWALVAGLCIILQTERGMALLFQSLAGAIVGGLTFLLCYILSKKQLGAGDVKLAFVMGLYLTGQRIVGAIFYGVVLCCIYSVVQLIRKKIGLKDGVALVPFLYLGVLITLYIL